MLRIAYLFLSQDISEQLIARWCQSEDHDYASKFKRQHRQYQSLGGRALLRMLWAIENSPHETKLNIHSSPTGAIDLEANNGKKVWGSIAHSHDLVCAAISDQMPIGIDCEKNDPQRDFSKIFSFLDLPTTFNCPHSLQTWVELEALGKAMHIGISQKTIDHYQLLKAKNAIFSTYFDIENYGVSVCLQQKLAV